MLKQIEGSRAVAEAVAMCRPQVICAYPTTPQTHIVEALSAMARKDELAAEFLNVESEFAAMSGQLPGRHGQGRPAGHRKRPIPGVRSRGRAR
jgi:pyruvate ferredoxin oxidoreductase alpha subunit